MDTAISAVDFIIIANPGAGKRAYKPKLDALVKELDEANSSFRTIYTPDVSYPDKINLLNKAIKEAKATKGILVIGGDGTLNEVINAVTDLDMPVGIISNGTGNDIVKSIHGQTNLQKQIEIIIRGESQHFNVGTCNGRIFINGVGLGFDGRIVEKMISDDRKLKGFWAYLHTVLSTIVFFREKPVSIVLDTKAITKPTFLISMALGTTFGGGFKINPYASHHDGYIDVCLIGAIPWYKRLLYLPRLKTGGHIRLKGLVEAIKAKNIVIQENDSMVAHLDGEYIGHPPFDISMYKRPIRFFC